MKYPALFATITFGLISVAFADSFNLSEPQGPSPDGREKISENQCRSAAFDFTERFPPESSQGEQGQCYAFAAAALYEEQACATGTLRCGTKISPIDITRDYPDLVDPLTGKIPLDQNWQRDYFRLAYANQGGVTHQILEAALDEGVCEERLAPWFPKLSNQCRIMDDRSGCVIDGLKDQKRDYDHEMRRWKRWSLDPEVRQFFGLFGKTRAERHREKLENIFATVLEYLPPEAQAEFDVQQALEESRDEFIFVQKALIRPACEDNRIRLHGTSWREDWSGTWLRNETTTRSDEDGRVITTTSQTGEKIYRSRYSNSERLGHFSEWVQISERSIGLSICSTSALFNRKQRADDPRVASACGPHAVVANGIRWNKQEERCEIHIRNSWSPSSPLRGWLPIESILNSTMRITGILPTGKN